MKQSGMIMNHSQTLTLNHLQFQSQLNHHPYMLNSKPQRQQNRVKGRKFRTSKKKFNRLRRYVNAPRNTTSYLIRAKKCGGIASLVSPCPVLNTPVFSPLSEAVVDMAKEEWGVDGYGSMNGLIRVRSGLYDENVGGYGDGDEDENESGSSESDLEEHVEVERRLDHDLSRFEMIYPNKDTHIEELEKENVMLKGKVCLMENELEELRRRLLCLERENQVVEDVNEEVVVENVSENESGLGDIHSPSR